MNYQQTQQVQQAQQQQVQHAQVQQVQQAKAKQVQQGQPGMVIRAGQQLIQYPIAGQSNFYTTAQPYQQAFLQQVQPTTT